MMLREVRAWVKTAAEMRETVERMGAMLDESHKKSVVFWAEYKRDFPEMKIDGLDEYLARHAPTSTAV